MTPRQALAAAKGEEQEDLTGRQLVKFDYYNPATGQYRTAIRAVIDGVPQGQLPPGSVVIPSTAVELTPGPQMGDTLSDQGSAETVKAGVYDLSRTNPETQELETILNYRGRVPDGWTIDRVDMAIEVDVPVRVVLGHDPTEALLAEARGETE